MTKAEAGDSTIRIVDPVVLVDGVKGLIESAGAGRVAGNDNAVDGPLLSTVVVRDLMPPKASVGRLCSTGESHCEEAERIKEDRELVTARGFRHDFKKKTPIVIPPPPPPGHK